MLIAYYLSGHDNLSHMWDINPFIKCQECGLRIEIEKKINPNFKLKKRLDFSYTYDDYLIVSEKVRQILLTTKIEGLLFEKLPKSNGFYAFSTQHILEFDMERRKTKKLNPCSNCGQYYEIIGSSPVCLKASKPIEYGIYRTDVSFGTGNNKSPNIIIGKKTYHSLNQHFITGLHAEKVLSVYDWEK